jgi:putative ABC transport system substrate-binding protein
MWLLIPVTSWGYDILIVQSQRSPVFEEVLRGFHSVARYSERVIVLSDSNEIDLVRVVREENPIAIITLGDNAMAAARKVQQTPIIVLMALNYRANANRHPFMTGVEIQSPPEKYLTIFASIKASKVGVLKNVANNTAYIKQARKIASASGIDLIVREVTTSRDVEGQLRLMSGIVDALWMLPDKVTSSGEAADAHFLFSASHKIPVITFSSAYLASGAAVALDIDRFDIGKQGGEMAALLMDGKGISWIPPEFPRKTTVKINKSVFRFLNLKPDFAGRSSE